MTYGLLFYWLNWLFWGMTTFFLEKNPLRSILSCLILVIILCSKTYLSIAGYNILLSFILLMIVFVFLFIKFSNSLYRLFVIFIIMIGYTAILFLKYRLSLSLFIPDFLISSIICSLLVVFLIKGLYHRLLISTLGIATGQILHGFILSSYHLSITIGDMDFFIELYLMLSLLLILHIIYAIKMRWYGWRNKLTLKF